MWRRLVARYLGVVEVVGSSPVTPTTSVTLDPIRSQKTESVFFMLCCFNIFLVIHTSLGKMSSFYEDIFCKWEKASSVA